MTKEKKPIAEMQKIEKVVVNIGVGKLRNLQNFDDKVLPAVMEEVAIVTGQKPATRQAKQAIAGFKTRTGDIVGLQVTLRRQRMSGFLKKVIHVALPRVKDFRGLELSNVDDHGNLNFGFREQFVFPEVSPEKSRIVFGMQVTVVPRDRDRDAAIDFYRSIGIPLKTK